MRVAPEGRPFIVASTAVLAGLVGLGALGASRWWIAALAWAPIAAWTPAFFRDPHRSGPHDARVLLAPADGKVVSVSPADEPEFLRGPATRVSVFMNVFNVHINYAPADGRVAYRRYRPGAFVNATLDKASEQNEQMSLGIQTDRGPVLVRQIAGLIARRIVTDPVAGAAVRQGQRFGLIRFGSRVDTFLPPNARPVVSVGMRTVGGVSVIGEWA
ncbi:MAG TPA: phosphatidylserine decarboxylase family protein [Gemmatimonadales bacterium]|nr:phosphatidylserine decarboxylase family protein [Gemmatimonadales bacterium]